MKKRNNSETMKNSFPTVTEDTNRIKNAQTKPKYRNFRNNLASCFLQIFNFFHINSKQNNKLLYDIESADSELSEPGQTFENKYFKRISFTDKITPLTQQSIRKSIMNEMKKCGKTNQLLYDMADGKITKTNFNLNKINTGPNELNVLLLWSACCKNLDLLEELVNLGANLSFSDTTHGLTALHIAGFMGCKMCTQFLVTLNGNINNINKWYSPLHCAALAKNAEVARILLDNGARLNTLTNGPGYETPLYIAVKVNAIECVKLFVERDAEIYQEGKLGDMSPLFLAAEMGHTECLTIILENRSVNVNTMRKIEDGNTPLHVAAKEGHCECIEILLDHGADPNLKNRREQSPLHLAVKANSYRSVITLIRKGKADPNLEDSCKKTPLHNAVEIVSDSRRDIVKALIGNGANVDVQDQHGFTALHVAALNVLVHCVCTLIKSGADYSLKSKTGITAFSLIAKKTPQAFETIKDRFSESISLLYQSDALTDIEMKFDFKNGLYHPKEYCILNAFIDAGHKEMLLHPFITAFLYVTWNRIRRCYYGMIYNSLMFSFMLLLYVLTYLAYECHKEEHNGSVQCTNRSYLNDILFNNPLKLETQWYILLYFTMSLAYRKIYGFYGYPSLKHYCMNWGNVLEWHGIIYVFIISFVYTKKLESWQLHVGAFAVICSWTNIMFLIGQLPVFGPYVEMFQCVQNEFQKLLLVFFPFIVGYTMSFCIIFPNSSTFYNPLIGLLSALVMMTGDMNYNILLDYSTEENSSNFAKFSAQLMYTFFLVFVTIILMNLLVGIAVHDIEGLQKNADLSRLVRQAKMCSYIEMSHFKRNKYAKSIMTLLRVVPKSYVPVLKVKPLDPEDTPILKEIIQAAYDLVKQREAVKKKLINRIRSQSGPWKRLVNGSVKQNNHASDVKWDLRLNQMVHKMEMQNDQMKDMHQQILDLKNIIKNGCSLIPLKDDTGCTFSNRNDEEIT